MENYQEKIQKVDDKIAKTIEKLEIAKSRVTALESEKQKLEFDRMQIIMDDYLPIIEELNLTPQELRDLFMTNKKESIEVDNEEY